MSMCSAWRSQTRTGQKWLDRLIRFSAATPKGIDVSLGPKLLVRAIAWMRRRQSAKRSPSVAPQHQPAAYPVGKEGEVMGIQTIRKAMCEWHEGRGWFEERRSESRPRPLRSYVISANAIAPP